MTDNSFSSHKRAVHWSEKNDMSSDDVPMNSHKKFWFDCDKCDHDFESSPNSVCSLGTWCPYCSNQKLCSDKTCKDCFKKSFASSAMAKYWIKNKNNKTPREVFFGSSKKYWFKCNKCHHDFEKPLKRIKLTNGWCYYCKSEELCEDEDCQVCFDKSLASHPKAKYFSYPDNEKQPRQIVKKGKTECTFECETCHHKFTLRVGNLVQLDQWCSYCSSRNRCDDSDCLMCFNI